MELIHISLEDLCREQGQPFRWLSQGDKQKSRIMRSILGTDEVSFASAPMCCGRVSDVAIFGKHFITDRPGRAVFYGQSHRNYENQDFIDKYQTEILDCDTNASIIETESCFVGGAWTGGLIFGHFIFEHLYRLAAFKMCGLIPKLPVVISDAIPENWISFIELYGVPRENIIKAPLNPTPRFRSVWVASCPNFVTKDRYYAFWDDGILDVREQLIANSGAYRADEPKRVFMGRKGSKHGRLTNEDEIWQYLEGEGFVYPDFENMDAAQQIRSVRSAEIIVAVGGSGSVMTHFAPLECHILEILDPALSGGLGSMGVAGVLGQQFSRLGALRTEGGKTGRRKREHDIWISPDLVKYGLEQTEKKMGTLTGINKEPG